MSPVCAEFRMPAMIDGARYTAAGVRLRLAEQADKTDDAGTPPHWLPFQHHARARNLDSIERAVESVVKKCTKTTVFVTITGPNS